MTERITYIGGHPCRVEIIEGKERFFYADTGEEVTKWVPDRVCPKCGLDPNDYGGQDPCIANLPGVTSACCGHGVKHGSIKFSNGIQIKGNFTVRKVKD